MRLRLTLAPLIVLAALLIAACTTAPATSSPAAATSGTGASPSGSAPASPAASVPGGSFALPQLHADPALEAQIPNQVNGATLLKLSVGGADLAQAAAAAPELAQLLQRMGTSAENVTVALGFDMGGTLNGAILAIRAAGTDPNRVIQELANAARQENASASVTQRTVGGKTVTTITEPNNPSGGIHLYVRGDVVFGVTGSAATIDQIIGQLP